MIFKQSPGNEPAAAEDRPMTEAEAKLIQKFEDNDKEIDGMLEGIID